MNNGTRRKKMIQFYNTMTKQVEEFTSVEAGVAKIYSCGPTVYNRAHIGNLRGFCFSDLLRRYLKFRGYQVVQVMNITDVDDKTIRDSKARNLSLRDFTEEYTRYFFEDIGLLNIERVEHYPRATEHIPEMISLIDKLNKQNLAYIKDGSVYFPIGNFEGYGRLSGHNPSLEHYETRIETDEYDKEDVRDFVLWKAWKEGEPYWETSYGKGRPGWHIECSAMSMKYLGHHFDIHTGGVDLIFPHHENEIAQSEGATGEPFVSFWLHNEFLLMGSDKMSKSLGNIIYLKDLLDLGFDPLTIRYFLISVHYRKMIKYSLESLEAARASVLRLRDFQKRLDAHEEKLMGTSSMPEAEWSLMLEGWRNQFETAMDNDLNISQGLAVIFEALKETNSLLDRGRLARDQVKLMSAFMADLDSVLGLNLSSREKILPEEIQSMIMDREKARKERNWALADQIRDALITRGITLEDTSQGTRWKATTPSGRR
jgi:cysteinyl-tRNA synthetase